MGCQQTVQITREKAIARIKEINALIADDDYLGVEQITNEHEASILDFVDNTEPKSVTKWTNSMIEGLLNQPFYRWSMFDNYWVVDELEHS